MSKTLGLSLLVASLLIINTEGEIVIGGQRLTLRWEKVSWDEAVAKCKSPNSRLAVLENPEAFHEYMDRRYRGKRFYLGGSDRSHEGTWTWINGHPMDNFPWPDDQPDNAHGEDCLTWGWGNDFNDVDCNEKFPYVCEHGCTVTCQHGFCSSYECLCYDGWGGATCNMMINGD